MDQPGSNLNDLVSTQKGGVTNLASLLTALQNAFPQPTTSTSPKFTGINTLGTTAAVVLAISTTRHGIVFHNPGTTSVYVFGTAITTAPTVAATGGAFLILPAATVPFPTTQWPNINCGFSAFAATGTAQPLTIVEFF